MKYVGLKNMAGVRNTKFCGHWLDEPVRHRWLGCLTETNLFVTYDWVVSSFASGYYYTSKSACCLALCLH